jgi:hypothetical protein
MYRLGPVLWQIFNQIAIKYVPSPVMKIDTENLFKNIGSVFPCSHCKDHYNNYIHSVDFNKVLETRDSCIDFIIDFHNHVNQRLRKQIVPYSLGRTMILNSSMPEYKSMVEIIPTQMLKLILEYNNNTNGNYIIHSKEIGRTL